MGVGPLLSAGAIVVDDGTVGQWCLRFDHDPANEVCRHAAVSQFGDTRVTVLAVELDAG